MNKIIICGSPKFGKSRVARIALGKEPYDLNHQYAPTIGAPGYNIKEENDQNLLWELWDLASQPTLKPIEFAYFFRSDVILIFSDDVTTIEQYRELGKAYEVCPENIHVVPSYELPKSTKEDCFAFFQKFFRKYRASIVEDGLLHAPH